MLTAPSLGYLLLSPMIIVFAAAVIGVLVEAFMGNPHSDQNASGNPSGNR